MHPPAGKGDVVRLGGLAGGWMFNNYCYGVFMNYAIQFYIIYCVDI